MVVGKAWAAIKDGQVITTISMRVPNWVDFDLYREKAKECLELVGEVKAGEVVPKDGQLVFIQRLNHRNRGKRERQPQEFTIPTTSH